MMKTTEDKEVIPTTFKLSLISISAALYALAIVPTSFIPTPWGVGNIRPGVLIPALFAVVYGPIIGRVGAAIGCFIGERSAKPLGTNEDEGLASHTMVKV